MEERGEGVVLYLESGTDVTMCKIKTIEYFIFRKLREKLKAHITNQRPMM